MAKQQSKSAPGKSGAAKGGNGKGEAAREARPSKSLPTGSKSETNPIREARFDSDQGQIRPDVEELDEMSRLAMVRARAYQIWLDEGQPQGRETEHWLKAEAEIRSGVKRTETSL